MTDLAALNPEFVYDETDERVWREELDPFLPPRIFDFHGHVLLKAHAPSKSKKSRSPSMPHVVDEYPHEVFAEVEKRLWPGREVKALVFGTVAPDADLDATNAYAAEAARLYGWEALLVPSIDDDADAILEKVRAGGFLGLKPYWTFVRDKAQNDVTLEDMVPPAMREAADRDGLIVMTHIPRPGRLADSVNIKGLRRLCTDAPNAKIVLAHFGRSYFPEAIGEGLSLADIDNLYPELSMVQDWEVVEAVMKAFDRKRILFGLDLPVAQEKGKCLGVNGQRHFFTKRPHPWSAHVEPGVYEVRCTLFAYEMARAIKKAAVRMGFSRVQVEDIFWNNAERLVRWVKEPQARAELAERRRPQLQMLWPEERLDASPEAKLPPGYELRTYRPKDQEAYLDLTHAAGFEGWDGDRLDHFLGKVLPGGLFVIEHAASGQLVATAMAVHSPSEGHPSGGELGWVATHPAHAGKGLGSAVCAAVTARFLRAGYRRVYLQTDDWRLAALKVYLNLGYEPFLCALGMEDRWRVVCEKLDWPFTPEAWPKAGE